MRNESLAVSGVSVSTRSSCSTSGIYAASFNPTWTTIVTGVRIDR
jgi:hypothetical protein